MNVKLTVNYDLPSRPVIINHLNIPIMDVTEEDAVVVKGVLTIVKGQCYNVFEELRFFKWLEGRVEVTLI